MENTDVVNATQNIIQDAQCPACQEYPRPDVSPYICGKGHLTCGPCGKKIVLVDDIKPCPLCRASTEQTKNFPIILTTFFAILCQNISYDCAYEKEGCRKEDKVEVLKNHEKECLFKPFKCFYSKCQNDSYANLVTFQQTHPSCFRILKEKNDCFTIRLNLSAMVDRYLGQVRRSGEIFKPVMLDIDEGNLYHKRVFIHFIAVPNVGVEIWLSFQGVGSILPPLLLSKRFCVMFSFESFHRPRVISTGLELNYHQKPVASKFVLSLKTLLDWIMWGRLDVPAIRNVVMTLYFPH